MGLYSTAHLVFGVPIVSHEAGTEETDYEPVPTPFWSEDDEYWVDLPAGLGTASYGHYENEDGDLAILTLTAVPRYDGDCWDVEEINPSDLIVAYSLREYGHSILRSAGLPGDFHQAKWCLVASFG